MIASAGADDRDGTAKTWAGKGLLGGSTATSPDDSRCERSGRVPGRL